MKKSMTIRNIPEDTIRGFRLIAAERTKENGGKKRVCMNTVMVEALKHYIGIKRGD